MKKLKSKSSKSILEADPTVTWKKLAYFTDIAATKLDDFATPDDNTDLNVSTAKHGLCPKGDGDTTHFLRSDINWAVPAGARLTSKVISATRAMTANSGDVSYTGVGFTPTVIITLMVMSTASIECIGFSDSAKTAYCLSNRLLGGGAYLGVVGSGVTAYQAAIVKSYDADGFTLTWTKTGSPTGTANLYFLCLK